MLSVVHGIITLKFCLCHYRIQIQRSEVVHLVGVGYIPENIENGARPGNGSWSQEGSDFWDDYTLCDVMQHTK